jgi:hypothetical protein
VWLQKGHLATELGTKNEPNPPPRSCAAACVISCLPPMSCGWCAAWVCSSWPLCLLAVCACLLCVDTCHTWGVFATQDVGGGGVQEVGGRGRPCHVLQWFSVNQSRGHDCPLAYTAYMRPWVYTKVVQIVHLPPAPGFLFWPACLSILVGWLCWVCAGTGHRTWPCFGCLTAVCLNGLCWCASREDWWLCFGGSLLYVSMSGLRGHGLYAV